MDRYLQNKHDCNRFLYEEGTDFEVTYMFVACLEDLKLAESHVEGRALQGTVRLLYHYDVDAATQSRLFRIKVKG